MFHFAFTLSISLAMAFGPMLCCCHGVHASAAGLAYKCDCVTNNAHHAACAKSADSGESPHHDHVPGDCVCSKQKSQLAAGRSILDVDKVVASFQSDFIGLAAHFSALSPVSNPSANCLNFNPAKLFGREMLRAYQILRC